MDLDIKKDLVSNWFKLLQDAFCNDIHEIKTLKLDLDQLIGKEIKKR